MAATQGTIGFHQDDQRTVFRVEGQATMYQSQAFRRFAENCLERSSRALWVDLRHCTFLDSTFTGTLLNLLRAANRRGPDGLFLISPSNQCAESLRQMGVEDLFRILAVEEESPASTWIELTKEPEDAAGFRHTILQAHEELASVPGAKGESFRAVVRCMSRDLEDKPLEKGQ